MFVQAHVTNTSSILETILSYVDPISPYLHFESFRGVQKVLHVCCCDRHTQIFDA